MIDNEPARHLLEGFPDAALHFFRAMELERQAVAASHGLSEFDLRAIFRIAAAGTMTPKDLAETLSVTRGAITGLSSRLVDAGLIRRAGHPLDRRSIHLELTEDGHAAMRAMHDDFRSMLSAQGTSVTDAQLAAAGEVLVALTERFNSRRPPPGR
jgi:DNA-binding MarR family transcriptional regulator